MSDSQAFVGVLMGSDSDLPIMQSSLEILDKFAVSYELKITSAHRTPATTHDYVLDAESRGAAVFIAAAGLAAHLAGTVAGLTIRPVIGVPMEAGPLAGMDALLSTVQMPGGIPVACMAIGKAGAKNAAYLAAQILALNDAGLAERIRVERNDNALTIAARDKKVQEQFSR